MAENDFKSSFTVNFSKKRPDFGDLEKSQRHEAQTRLYMPYALIHMNSI